MVRLQVSSRSDLPRWQLAASQIFAVKSTAGVRKALDIAASVGLCR